MDTLGAPGAGIAIALENLFPPLPSEVILPRAGFAAVAGGWACSPSCCGRRGPAGRSADRPPPRHPQELPQDPLARRDAPLGQGGDVRRRPAGVGQFAVAGPPAAVGGEQQVGVEQGVAGRQDQVGARCGGPPRARPRSW